MKMPAIRDLDAAEAAYRRSLELHDPNDALGRSRCIKQIGMVHHERFNEARGRGEPDETVLRHAQAAEQHYRQALALCPPSAVADLGPMHNQLGSLYAEVGQTEPAREHYEKTLHSIASRPATATAPARPATTSPSCTATPPAASRPRPAAAIYCAAPRPTRRPACGISSTTRAAPRMEEAKAQRLIEGIARELGGRGRE